MANSPILNLPQVAPNQNQKESTINTAQGILEAAANDGINLAVAANRTLTADEYTRAFMLTLTGLASPFTVSAPNTKRFFAVSNTGASNATIKVSGSSGATVVVEPGKRTLIYSNGVDMVAISSGNSNLSGMSDTAGVDDASDGQALVWDASSSRWTPADMPSDHSITSIPKPTNGQTLYKYVFTRNERFYSDYSGSQGHADDTATATTVFNVYKNTTLVGHVTFTAGSATPTFSTDLGSGSSSVTYAPGDRMTVTGPAVADATLARLSFTLRAVYL
ncbi:tail fiber protein [Caulobacter phage C1]|nr:tail fiber protein [Caulobacter phage C1]UTU08389.1 tail fiber protein [Caulobacter phage C2]UTU08906.1 tail fibers protein [Caulobacter phage J4]UTU09462.1 tail fibers protein [Caulobacter phage BL47]UTU10022.1 tail fibers protein [Caulobacter phage RB23]WGN97057.1 tail fiber protein [Bertelyvirus sp.]